MSTPTLKPRIRFKTPQICHKSFLAPPTIPAGALPPTLNGFASWRDPDPLNPADLTTVLSLRLKLPIRIYGGTSPGKNDFFTFLLSNFPNPAIWRATLTLHGQRVPPEDYEFQPFAIDLTKPFDTKLRTEHPAQPAELRQFQFTY